eukprot:gene47545-biopygen37560
MVPIGLHPLFQCDSDCSSIGYSIRHTKFHLVQRPVVKANRRTFSSTKFWAICCAFHGSIGFTKSQSIDNTITHSVRNAKLQSIAHAFRESHCQSNNCTIQSAIENAQWKSIDGAI